MIKPLTNCTLSNHNDQTLISERAHQVKCFLSTDINKRIILGRQHATIYKITSYKSFE